MKAVVGRRKEVKQEIYKSEYDKMVCQEPQIPVEDEVYIYHCQHAGLKSDSAEAFCSEGV